MSIVKSLMAKQPKLHVILLKQKWVEIDLFNDMVKFGYISFNG